MARSETKNSAWAGSAPRSAAADRVLLARFLADLLDQRFTIPGTSVRIGLDPILALIPGLGDAIANIAGSAILLIAARLNVPKIVLIRMGLNIAANALIGAVPLLGAVFSIWFRSNAKNAALLERYAQSGARRATLREWLFVIGIVATVLLIVLAMIAAVVGLIRSLAAAS